MTKNTNNFMQTTSQLVNSNTQAIFCLEMQLSQLAITISEREKEKWPSQSEPNPKILIDQQSQPEGQFNHVNVIHTLRSGRQVDNQVDMT